jgi:CHAT domain-containing protein/Tfp pilus assembly protein PilF
MILSRLLIAVLLGLFWTVHAAANDEDIDARLIASENLYREQGPEIALPEFERLAAEFNQSQQRLDEAVALHFIGECHWRIGDFDSARAYLDRALLIKRNLGNRLQEAKTLNVLGLLEWELGNYDQATGDFEQASAIGRDLGNKKLEGATLNNLSLVYDELGDYQTSLQQYQQVLQIYSVIDFPRGTGDTLNNIGRVHLLLGDYRKALGYFEQSLEISQQLESKPSMSVDLGNIALCYLGLGQIDAALEKFESAIELAEETGMRYDLAYWLGGKGNALVLQGRYDQGLIEYRAMLDIYEQQGDHVELIESLHDMGRLHMLLGDPASAEQYFSRSIAVARDIGRVSNITLNLMSLGDLELRRERLPQADDFYGQAKARADEIGDKVYMAASRLRLAQVSKEQEDLERGFEHAREALRLARDIEARPLQGEALFMLAELDREDGRPADALKGYAAAEATLAQSGAPELLWQIHYGRAMAFETQGDKNAAVNALTSAVKIIESIRDRLIEQRFRSGYLQDKYEVYVDLVRLQLDLGRTSDAFSTAERLRAKSFATQLDRGGWPDFSSEDQRKQNELRERIRQLQRALNDEEVKASPDRRQAAVQSFSRELLVAQRDYQTFLDDREQEQKAAADLPVPASERIQRRLAGGDVMLEYVVGENSLMIFVLTPAEIFAVTSPSNRDDIKRRVELLRDLLRTPDDNRWIKPAASLASVLTQPLMDAGWLTGSSHLYIVPHSYLNYLPFAVLPQDEDGGERLLIDEFTLSYLPTATALFHESRSATGPPGLLAMAPSVSRLQHAPDEARSIDALFQPHSRLLIGASATESSLKQLASDVDVLHLATHGYFNKLNPLFSGVRLEADDANDGLLEVHEVFGLELHTNLVTLSACETALGGGYFAEVPAGDEFVGLTQAFLSAGSESVVATLWEVDDRSTVDLMTEFYGRLNDPGVDDNKSAALAFAQKGLRSETKYRHPYYWAPFVLIGNVGDKATPQKIASEVAL